ncbi:thioredoxin-like protein [Lipomyces oligophaga]|uniref:thioredoxin-like protein n=1 Tax=Lipomyces oligophaga TaxID=45792 RepID=UPI0034CE0766
MRPVVSKSPVTSAFLLRLLFIIGLLITFAVGDVTESSSEKEHTDSIQNEDATVDLDPDRFNAMVIEGHGTWWVKHFSPYCVHCKALAPIWSLVSIELAESAAAHDFHFANIDCYANGDLCQQNGISKYPTLILYRDGKLVERYAGSASRSAEGLAAYAKKNFIAGADQANVGQDADTAETTDSNGTNDSTVDDSISDNISVESELGTEKVMENAAAPVSDSAKPPATPNPEGISVPLTKASFNKLVTSSGDGYFIKFYTPWCPYCKALEPAWIELARQMKGKLNIAEVNCEEEKRLCKVARVQGFPDLMYFLGSERIEYDGLRGVGDLVAFANQAMSARVRSVDASEFEEIEKKEEVIFLYFFDETTAKEDFVALERVSLPLIGHAPIFTTSSSILASRFRVTTFPRLVATNDGRPSYYPALSPKEMRDHLKVLAWMKTVWLPLLPELTASNSHEIMHGRTVVLGILDKSKEEELEAAKKELKATASKWIDYRAVSEKAERQSQRELKVMKIEEAKEKGDDKALKEANNMHIVLSPRKEVGFAWVDGLFWERWLQKTYGINVRATGPRVIINDEDNKQYWDQDVEGQNIVPTASAKIFETIKVIFLNENKIKAKSTTSRFVNFVQTVKSITSGYPFAFLSFVAGIILAVAWWWRGKMRRSMRGMSTTSHPVASSAGGKFD